MVHAHDLGDLVADREHGIERGHRFLEDHRDARAANVAHRPFVEREEVAAVERDLRCPARSRPGGATRRRIESAVTDLPQPDSPTSPTVSPARDVERDAVHGAGDAVLGVEVGAQVANGGAAAQPFSRWFGGRGREAIGCRVGGIVKLPRIEDVAQGVAEHVERPATVMTIARPGKNTTHQLPREEIRRRPGRSCPSSPSGLGTPMPRNESPASSTITLPTASVAATITGASDVRQHVSPEDPHVGAPSARAATT